MSLPVPPRISLPIVEKRQDRAAIVQLISARSCNGVAREIIWEAPTEEDWQRVMQIFSQQFARHVTGYVDQDEFIREGCQFAYDRLATMSLKPTHCERFRTATKALH
jgi:hypothetical protein